MEQERGPQQRDAAVFFRWRSSCELGSGRLEKYHLTFESKHQTNAVGWKKTQFSSWLETMPFFWQSVFTYHLLKANLSRGTRCMTAVLPHGRPSAESVTLPCRKRPCGQIIVNVVRDFWPTRSYLVYELWPTWYMIYKIPPGIWDGGFLPLRPPPPSTLLANCRKHTEQCLQHSHCKNWKWNSPEGNVINEQNWETTLEKKGILSFSRSQG